VTDLTKASETKKSHFFHSPTSSPRTSKWGPLMVRATNRTKFIILFLFENKRRLNRCEGLKNVLCALIKELFVWFVWWMNTSQPCHPRLLSMVPSSRCQVRLTVCERSATQKCINLPNSFFRSPRVRDTRRIVEGQIIHAARSFYIPAAVHGHPSPW
jgi:hypothetical protein